jgi:ankyrin repeat protein
MPERHLPVRPSLRRLKQEAKSLHRAIRSGESAALADLARFHPASIHPGKAKLADAYLVLARSYGFSSWPRLLLACARPKDGGRAGIIKSGELDAAADPATWDAISAAADGDTAALRHLLRRNPKLARAEFWYTPAIHFAVREGHAEAVQLLLESGADPEWNGLHQGSLIDMARERGHAVVAELLAHARNRRGRVAARPADHPVHVAACNGDVLAVRELLDGDPHLTELGNAAGATLLHIACRRGDAAMVGLLLERGANVHAVQSAAAGLSGGLWTDLQAIDLAIWHSRRRSGDDSIARMLLERGATHDLTVAAALGHRDRVRQLLDQDPTRIRGTRPSGRRPLSAAIEFGHDDIARLLLERGADPGWAEPTAARGRALHAAASAGSLAMVELLLAHGADPNSTVDSSGSATYIAHTPEIRALLLENGGTLDPYVAWIGDDDALIRRVANDPDGTVLMEALTTICTLGKRDVLARLLQTGVRLPRVITSCQTYLLEHADMLRMLLDHGMSPDLMNWQYQTLLHFCCQRSDRADAAAAIERATILLDAGADINARDAEYRSSPLAWAARSNAMAMVEFLLARGAPTELPDDEPWATPLAWAERRGNAEVASILRRHDATR